MDKIWTEMYEAASAVRRPREITGEISAGEVAAAVQSESGKIYVGVCVDTACTLGICAERNALFNMITNGESRVRRVLAVMGDGGTGAPCGACREFLMQLGCRDAEIMLDYRTGRTATLAELTPEWWI